MRLSPLAIGALAIASLAAPAEARRDHWHDNAHFHGPIFHDRDIGRFHERDFVVWRAGGWHHSWHGGRYAWWWVIGPSWYYYPAPAYPYPDPYRPPIVVEVPAPVNGPAPQQFWYYCESPKGYYPYVPSCRTEWRPVPSTPPVAAPPAGSVPPAPPQ
jgi:hypothetical protein